MTSINTNIAATTALRTLQSTNMQLDQTQSRISTGLKIAEAKDNAAYWSISTTLKSDNKALGTVKDALGLGAATVDVAYQGLNQAQDVLNEIKTKLTAASQSGVDKEKINAEIVQLKQQLESIASSSTFSGENWLNNSNGMKEIVSSFTRGTGNVISIGTVGINTDQVALYNATDTGIIDGVSTVAVNSFTATNVFDLDPAIMLDADDVLTFTVAQGSGAPVEVRVNQAVVNSALGAAAAGKIASGADLAAVMNKALTNAQISGVTATVNALGTSLVFSGNVGFTVGSASVNDGGTANANFTTVNLGIVNGGATGATPLTASVNSISIGSSTTKAQLEAMIKIVSTATDKVITQAANLGAVSSRIELQQSFVNTLMDTIDQGISGLVDADMNEESTRLQALQVKQQLGVQALSIANQSAQNVLSLFR